MALPLALLAVVVIGGFVAAAFSLALLERRMGLNVLYAVQAAGAAETGVAEVVAGWEGHGLGGLAPGQTAVLAAVQLPGRTSYAPAVGRLNPNLFLVQVTGTRTDAAGGTLARRRLHLIVRQSDTVAPGALAVTPLPHRAWTRPSP